jgi:hypothetical protein
MAAWIHYFFRGGLFAHPARKLMFCRKGTQGLLLSMVQDLLISDTMDFSFSEKAWERGKTYKNW